ncbi:A-kinase-interacting protein 1 isoform X2 [Choloepus didactylus]|uniref:A-kinase-interacting protein 1 isoform X2 n=1 Tax=Choloepus didactylus TaxID=27675 RepID=UPI00189C7B2A|nr:A-kinase-interacting protein 1 isoform X2 [Choloepus didactylus]
MENYLAAAALNGVNRLTLQRSARLGQEVLERAKRRAVDWHSLELPKGSIGVLAPERPDQERRPATGPQRLFPEEREERHPTLNASFRTMAEFMDYTSSQCGKYYSSVPEEGGATHVYRYHRGKSELRLCSERGNGQDLQLNLQCWATGFLGRLKEKSFSYLLQLEIGKRFLIITYFTIREKTHPLVLEASIKHQSVT